MPGDTIDILTAQGWFVYRVTGSQAVAPTDVAVVAPTPTPTLTLTTCNPRYSASQRLVVQATLVADVLTPAPASGAGPDPATASPGGTGGTGRRAAALVAGRSCGARRGRAHHRDLGAGGAGTRRPHGWPCWWSG